MRASLSVLRALLVLLTVLVAVRSQERTIRIEESLSVKSAVSDEIVSVYLDDVGGILGVPLPEKRFEVLISQKGETHSARIRSVNSVMIPSLRDDKKPGSQTKANKKRGAPSVTEDRAVIEEIYQVITFTVPRKLTEGEASLTVLYRNQPSNSVTLKIPGRLRSPFVYGVSGYIPVGSQHPGLSADPNKKAGPPPLTFERGKKSEIIVSPLIDPDTPDSGLLITFRQGGFVKEVAAQVKQVGGATPTDNSAVVAPVMYRVTVRTPEQLAAGPVEIEARLRSRGELSEPGHAVGIVSDPSAGHDAPETTKPQINNFHPGRLGVGQVVELSVDSAQKLGPDPKNVIVVIEQDGRRIELKPEVNSALQEGVPWRSGPTLLIARVGGELTGKVKVRVYNPARGEEGGMSEGVPIEIVDEVLPPVVTDVSEASRQDISLLRSLHQRALSAGRDFGEYDPKRKYVAIQVTGIDYNPEFRRIQFEQGGLTYTLVFDDYSLSMPGRLVVRAPEWVKPGPVRVTIQNRGTAGFSDPIIRTFVMSEPGR